jgi:ABC-type phosphate/phosphonate transport system ATPase subunit
MIHKPTILLADEPFTGLDTDSCEHLVAVLSDFQQKGGTIVMTTHDINLGLRCCRRAIVLDSSKIIFDAATDTIDADVFTKDYVNYPGSKQ